MLSIDRFRNELGLKAASLTEKEIERIRDIQDQLAEVLFDSWVRRINQEKGELTVSEKGRKI